jgi:tetratricopeptide (TPR) repeat protein
MTTKENVEKWSSALEYACKPGNEIKYVISGHDKQAMEIEDLKTFINQIKYIRDSFNNGKELFNANLFTKTEGKTGLEGLKTELAKLRPTENSKYFLIEAKTNEVAGAFLNANKIRQAIETYKLMAESFPESWRTYNGLAEAYLKAGNKEFAVENYEKSLKLNPENINAFEQLKKLKAN